MIRKRFRFSVLLNSSRVYPSADVGSDHNLLLMNVRLKLRRNKLQKCGRIRYNIDKLKDTEIRNEFNVKIEGKFEPLLLLEDPQEITHKFTGAVNDVAEEVLGKKRRTVKESTRSEQEYKEANNRVKAEIKRPKSEWIEGICKDIQEGFETNNRKKSFDA